MTEEISRALQVGARCTQGCCRATSSLQRGEAQRHRSGTKGNRFVNSAPVRYLAGPRRRQDTTGLRLLQAPALSLPGLMPGLSPSRQREAKPAQPAARSPGLGYRDRLDLAARLGTTAELLYGSKVMHRTPRGLCKLSHALLRRQRNWGG